MTRFPPHTGDKRIIMKYVIIDICILGIVLEEVLCQWMDAYCKYPTFPMEYL